MGLLDTGDPEKDAALYRGLLTAGLQLMQSRGRFLPSLGQGGFAGLGGYENERNRQLAAKRIGLQDEILKNQADEQKRQAELAKLPGQFYRAPSQPGIDATGGAETAMENPANAAGPGGFDLTGYANALLGKSPLQAIQLQQLLKKDTTPISVAKDAVLLDPNTRQPIFSNVQPSDDKESPVAKLIRERDKFPVGDPTRRIYDDAITRASTHAPPAQQINYGNNTVPVQNPDGSITLLQLGNKADAPPKVVVNPLTGKPAIQAAPVPSAATKKDIAENTVALGKIDNALGLLGATPGALGAQNYLPEAVTQRLDPGGVKLRAAIADIGSQKIHDRSGANVTISEAPRLKPFIPDVRDTPAAVRIKLDGMRKEYAAMQQALAGGASISEAGKADVPKVRKYNPETGKIE